MSDYFTRMAQYSRGEADIVLPKLPGFFGPQKEEEAGSTAAATPLAHTTMQTTVAPHGTSEKRRKNDPIEKNWPRPVSGDTSPLEKNNDIDGLGEWRPEKFDRKKEQAVTSSTASHHRVHIASSNILEGAEQEEQEESEKRIPVDRSATAREDPFSAAPFQAESGARLFSEAVTGVEQVNDLVPSAELLVPQYLADKTGDPREVVFRPPENQQEVEKEPTIHINIGRVEVRAQIASPTPAARVSRRKDENRLSLDAYLKRCGGQS